MISDKQLVLILNKNWMPINTTSQKNAIVLIFSGKAKGVFVSETEILPLSWEKWNNISLLKTDQKIKTTSGYIKIPSVVLLERCDKIPRRTVKFTQKHLWERDNFTCQYTGKHLTKLTGNIDHVIPKSVGGKTSWENCVLSHKEVNALKRNRTPEQAGLCLLRKPVRPTAISAASSIKNPNNILEWNIFLKFS